MWDTEMYFVNRNKIRREKGWIEDQRITSLRFLAFWSSPAWFRSPKQSSFPAVAIKEWIACNRLAIALKKETIEQVIGSVKEVIPNSKLAKYGDFRYDVNSEEIYCLTESLNPKSCILKTDKCMHTSRYDVWASETETNISDERDNGRNQAFSRNSETELKYRVRSLSEWLKELNQILISVRQIANEAQLLDSWTETLLKFCLTFIYILRNNANLTKLLDSEISFIHDYERLRKMRISKFELQSIPQPENRGDTFLEDKNLKVLWLKLSSSQIRNIWKTDTISFLNNENLQSKHLVPLININFLRSHPSKSPYSSRLSKEVCINISKNKEFELLGSLLNVIDENFSKSGERSVKVDDTHFPEAHGEWTKQLFPHRINVNSTTDKDSAVNKLWKVAQSPQVIDSPVKLESGSSEALPLQFYKCVPPPPTVPTRFITPYMHCHPRQRLVYVSSNNMTCNPPNQQVQYKVAATSVSNIPQTTYVSQISASPHRVHTSAAEQCHRRKFLRGPCRYYHSQSTKEPEKYLTKVYVKSNSEINSTDNEKKDLNEEKYMHHKEETRCLNNIPAHTTTPFVQLRRGYNIPFRTHQNVRNANGNINITPHSVISNSQTQVQEPRVPLKMNYPVTNIMLQTPMIKNIPPGKRCILPQFTSKPRPIKINNIRQMQKTLLQQRHHYDYTNETSHQKFQKSTSYEDIPSYLNSTSLDYEDKVEKWLESVKTFATSSSHVNLEELAEHPCNEAELSSIQLPKIPNSELPKLPSIELTEISSIKLPSIELLDVDNTLANGGKGDHKELEISQYEHTSDIFKSKVSYLHTNSQFNTFNYIKRYWENRAVVMRRKKIKAKKDILELLQPSQNIVQKLRKRKKLRNKIKIVRRYFADINSNSRKINIENFIKILRRKQKYMKNVQQPQKGKYSVFREKYPYQTKIVNLDSTKHNLDMHQSSFLINDIFKYRILIGESQEFNSYPCKHLKLNELQPAFFETHAMIRNEEASLISSLKYLDSRIDELFFQGTGNDRVQDAYLHKVMNAEINGWAHFKIAVKSVMKTVLSSLHAQILNNS